MIFDDGEARPILATANKTLLDVLGFILWIVCFCGLFYFEFVVFSWLLDMCLEEAGLEEIEVML